MASRSLHWCFKIGDRKKSIQFYRDLLAMKVLRHEEFDEGCKATCNGPYNNKWSKTLVGYGPEEENFTLELTHNYPISAYTVGNDLESITIQSSQAIDNVKNYGLDHQVKDNCIILSDPDGYKLTLCNGQNRFHKVTINVTHLHKSVDYYSKKLGMNVLEQTDDHALLAYSSDQCWLELKSINTNIDHGTGWGRIAFGLPLEKIYEIQSLVKNNNDKVLHDLVELGTPGKASVFVIILHDPDLYEICLVGIENYSKLCTVDPNANQSLEKSMQEYDQRKKK